MQGGQDSGDVRKKCDICGHTAQQATAGHSMSCSRQAKAAPEGEAVGRYRSDEGAGHARGNHGAACITHATHHGSAVEHKADGYHALTNAEFNIMLLLWRLAACHPARSIGHPPADML